VITSTSMLPGLTWVRIERRDLTPSGAQRFVDLLRSLAGDGAMMGFSFDGWDFDERAVYDIPEVREFMLAAMPRDEDLAPDVATLQEFVHRLYDDSAFISGNAPPIFGCYQFLLMGVGSISVTAPDRRGSVQIAMKRRAVAWAARVVRDACSGAL
jgi:hypothetical protein